MQVSVVILLCERQHTMQCVFLYLHRMTIWNTNISFSYISYPSSIISASSNPTSCLKGSTTKWRPYINIHTQRCSGSTRIRGGYTLWDKPPWISNQHENKHITMKGPTRTFSGTQNLVLFWMGYWESGFQNCGKQDEIHPRYWEFL